MLLAKGSLMLLGCVKIERCHIFHEVALFSGQLSVHLV